MKNAFANLRSFLFISLLLLNANGYGQSISGIINSYYRINGINIVPNTVTVTSAAGLSPGMKILIIQSKGAAINTTNTNSFGSLDAIGNAGNYEFNFICGIAGNNVLLQYELRNTYDVPGLVQLIPVPQFASVTVTDTLKPMPWDPVSGTGGVLIMELSDTLHLNSVIDASAAGFTGAAITNYTSCVWATDVTAYYLPVTPADPNANGARKGEGIAAFVSAAEYGRGKQGNGGGGGNNHNTGGGGGSNYGVGGDGGVRSNETTFACHGTRPGIGGTSLAWYGYTIGNNRLFMGGGGGAGHENNFVATPGGNGGGIVIIIARVIINNGGRIMANGASGINPICSNPYFAEGDGGGGGGGGGAIVVQAQQITGSPIATDARGAQGSIAGNATNNCTGPGGGGGGGVVWVNSLSTLAGLTPNVTGGLNGVISAVNSTPACRSQANGATSGTNGFVASNYVEPLASNFVCAPLPQTNLVSISGSISSKGNTIRWTMRRSAQINMMELQRSVDQRRFEAITSMTAGSGTAFVYEDETKPAGTLFYRLKWTEQNGSVFFSKIIAIDGDRLSAILSVIIGPNPASSHFTLTIAASKPSAIQLKLINPLGKVIWQQATTLVQGSNEIIKSVSGYSPGIYVLRISSEGSTLVKKIIIQNP